MNIITYEGSDLMQTKRNTNFVFLLLRLIGTTKVTSDTLRHKAWQIDRSTQFLFSIEVTTERGGGGNAPPINIKFYPLLNSLSTMPR
jgi:hypothetical protein